MSFIIIMDHNSSSPSPSKDSIACTSFSQMNAVHAPIVMAKTPTAEDDSFKPLKMKVYEIPINKLKESASRKLQTRGSRQRKWNGDLNLEI